MVSGGSRRPSWLLPRSARKPGTLALRFRSMLKVILTATAADMFRSRRSLLAELALLRHQLTVLQCSVARPRVTRFDRIALVALAAITPTWRNVLRIVQPETLLRWRHAGSSVSGGGAAGHPRQPASCRKLARLRRGSDSRRRAARPCLAQRPPDQIEGSLDVPPPRGLGLTATRPRWQRKYPAYWATVEPHLRQRGNL
jgi:hypothetical protein